MAASTSLVKALPLVLLLATLGNSGGDLDVIENQQPKFVTALKGVRDVLECFGDNVKESLQALSEEVFHLREEITSDNKSLELKCKSGDSNSIHQLIQDNIGLKNQLAESEKQVQDLGRRLGECQPQVEKLQKQIKQLNDTVESLQPADWTQKCSHPNLPQIKIVVRDYDRSRNWAKLRKGLEGVLDHTSEAFQQLPAGSLMEVGHRGNIQLAAVLICGGMNIDAGDAEGNNLLMGAARRNHLDMVKYLIAKGADVNARGQNNWTPLIWAAYKQLLIVQSLVDAGADTTAKGTDGRTAFSWANAVNNHAVVRYLEVLPQ